MDQFNALSQHFPRMTKSTQQKNLVKIAGSQANYVLHNTNRS